MMIDNLAVLHVLSNDLSCDSEKRTNKREKLEELLKGTRITINKILCELEAPT